MRVVYYVLSHTNVSQVVRLIRTIVQETPESLVLVHHDAREAPFDRASFAGEPRVRVLDRSIRAEWAQFSLVEIALAGIDDLASRGTPYDWLVLLSGQDYPVRPIAEFEAALARSGDGFLEFDPEPGVLLDRYRFAWRRLPRPLEFGIVHRLIGVLTRLNDRQPYVRFLSGRVGCRIGFLPRRIPLVPGMQIYKGTQWWALSARATSYVREFVPAHPEFVAYFRDRTIIPDEAFFQTILLNAPGFTFVNDDERFTIWAGAAAASPEILRLGDEGAIRASGSYFARKFDTRVDARIVDALDGARRG